MARRREAALASFCAASGLAGMVYWPKVTSFIEAPETSLLSNMAPARLELSNTTRVIFASLKLIFLGDTFVSLLGSRLVCCDGCCAASAVVSACSISCAEAGCDSAAEGGCVGLDGLDGSAGEKSAREKSALSRVAPWKLTPRMFVFLQHEASQARGASDARGGASGAGRGFEACGVTRRSSPAFLPYCNTRHRRHARASDERAGASGAWRGFEACGVTRHSPLACLLHCNTRHHRHARRQMNEQAPAGARVRGLWRYKAFICRMFAFLQHETPQAREASDERAGASGARRRF
eukprot:scaffold10159_cov63-Phaeocystis_antarctica.AAC.3